MLSFRTIQLNYYNIRSTRGVCTDGRKEVIVVFLVFIKKTGKQITKRIFPFWLLFNINILYSLEY